MGTTTISTTTTATRKSTTLTRKSTTLPPAGTEIQGQTIPTTDEGKEEEAGKTTSLPTEPLTQERKETPAPLITLPQPSEQTQPTVEEGKEEEGEPCGYVKVLTTIMGKTNNYVTDECRAILLPDDTPTPLPHGGVCKTTCKGEADPNHTASLKCDNGKIIYEALDCPPRTERFGHGSYR